MKQNNPASRVYLSILTGIYGIADPKIQEIGLEVIGENADVIEEVGMELLPECKSVVNACCRAIVTYHSISLCDHQTGFAHSHTYSGKNTHLKIFGTREFSQIANFQISSICSIIDKISAGSSKEFSTEPSVEVKVECSHTKLRIGVDVR